MENILLFLIPLVLLKTLFMGSLLPKKRDILLLGIICAIWIFGTHFFAIEQNKLVLENAINSKSAIGNLSIIVMIDLMLTLGFCQSLVKKIAGEKLTMTQKIVSYAPSILIFPVASYLHILLFFQFPGHHFGLITTVFGLLFFIFTVGGSLLIRKIIHEAEVRIELVLVFGLLLFLLAICFMVFHPSTLTYSYSQPVEWKQLLFTLISIVLLMAIGLAWQLFYRKRKARR